MWPIQYAILTNILPTPNDPSVSVIFPLNPHSDEARKYQLETISNQSLLIVVNRNISITELKNYLNNPKNEVVKSLTSLPSLNTPRTNKVVMFWGQIASTLKKEYPNDSWSTIFNKIDGILNLKSVLDTKPDTTNELLSCVIRYKRSLEVIDTKEKDS